MMFVFLMSYIYFNIVYSLEMANHVGFDIRLVFIRYKILRRVLSDINGYHHLSTPHILNTLKYVCFKCYTLCIYIYLSQMYNVQ